MTEIETRELPDPRRTGGRRDAPLAQRVAATESATRWSFSYDGWRRVADLDQEFVLA